MKLDQQSSAEHEEFKMDYLWASLKDWKTYTGMMIYMGCDGALYAVRTTQEIAFPGLLALRRDLVANVLVLLLLVLLVPPHDRATNGLQERPRTTAERAAIRGCSGRDDLHRVCG